MNSSTDTSLSMSIVLRCATEADAERLLEWVNTPDSLAGKLVTSAPIDRPSHLAWLARRLADPETKLWVIEHNHRPIGQLRAERRAGAWEIDIFLDRIARGGGRAQRALLVGLAQLDAKARARVRPSNTASQRLFERTGFHRVAATSDHIVYERHLGQEPAP